MGAILFLFSVVISIAGGAIVLVAVVLLLQAIQRAMPRSPPPSELARAIGLVPRGSHEAVGERDGIRVQARWTSVKRGSGKRRRTVRVMRYSAAFDPPLRMGLGIGREGLLDGLFDSIGVSSDVVVGDPELDRALRVRAIDAAHAAALLADPGVRAPLLAGAQYGVFAVNDERVACGYDGWDRAASEVARSTELVCSLALAIRAARSRTRAAWELALDESWGAIARTESMQWSPDRSRLAARAGDAWVVLEVAAVDGRLITRLALRFDAPLGLGLRIVRTGMGAKLGALLGAQDVRCGHRTFDDAFTVKARDAETARHLLAEGGADAVVRIVSVLPELEVTDAGADASIGTVLADPRAAGSVMRAAIELAGALRGGAGPQAGAYR